MKRIAMVMMMALGCGGVVEDPEAPTRALSASSDTARATGVVAWEAYNKRLIGKRADGSLALDMRVLEGQRLAVETPERATISLTSGRFEGLSPRTMELVAAYVSDDGREGLPEGVQAAPPKPQPKDPPPSPGCPEGCALALLRSCNGIVEPPSCGSADPVVCCTLAYVRCC